MSLSNETMASRLSALGLTLPIPPKAAANYVPFAITPGPHSLVFISGQLPSIGNDLTCVGRLGENVTLEEGQLAARQCALNILAHLNVACEGDLSRIHECVKLTGFINATYDFTDHPKVMNGASDLMVEVLGQAGRHARAAVGVVGLPFGVAVEVEAIFALKPTY